MNTRISMHFIKFVWEYKRAERCKMWPSIGFPALPDKYHLSLPIPSLSRVGGSLRVVYTHTVVLKTWWTASFFMYNAPWQYHLFLNKHLFNIILFLFLSNFTSYFNICIQHICNGNDISIARLHTRFSNTFSQGPRHHEGLMIAWQMSWN